jgi:hypothetical protein
MGLTDLVWVAVAALMIAGLYRLQRDVRKKRPERWSPDEVAGLSRAPFGLSLATAVADALVAQGPLNYSHKDYCGHGLFHEGGSFHLAEFHDGDVRKRIASWADEASFIEFLSAQSDYTCSGADGASPIFAEVDRWLINNQRIDGRRLRAFAYSFSISDTPVPENFLRHGMSIDPETGVMSFAGLSAQIQAGAGRDKVATELAPFLFSNLDHRNGYEWLYFRGLAFGGKPATLSVCFLNGAASKIHWDVWPQTGPGDPPWPSRKKTDGEVAFVRDALSKMLSRPFSPGTELFSWGEVWCVYDDRDDCASSGLRYATPAVDTWVVGAEHDQEAFLRPGGMTGPGSLPRCLANSLAFPHKDAILEALQAGATIRRDPRVISAETHAGIWSIRLRAAQAPEIRGHEELRARQAEDIRRFLEKLEGDLSAPTRAWFVSCTNGEAYTIVEDARTGNLIGCLRGGKDDR